MDKYACFHRRMTTKRKKRKLRPAEEAAEVSQAAEASQAADGSQADEISQGAGNVNILSTRFASGSLNVRANALE
jgi:hypothetical protein